MHSGHFGGSRHGSDELQEGGGGGRRGGGGDEEEGGGAGQCYSSPRPVKPKHRDLDFVFHKL